MSLPTALNHIAFQTDDLEATHRFYTEVLGFRFAGAVRQTPGQTTSSGEKMPDFLHTFYEMPSGECVAFFDVEDTPKRVDDGWAWWTRHLALSLESTEAVDAYAQRLRDNGVQVRGPVDHDGLWYSVYCFDPTGVHLEFTYQTRELGAADASEAEELYSAWIADRQAGRVK